MSHTLGQQRAAYCLEMLKTLTSSRGDFKVLSAGLPSMILQNGFGQTLAFLLSKGKDKHQAAFGIIALWLVNRKFINPSNQQVDILNQISKMNQFQYLHAQRETLAMLEWLKRYANAALFEG